MKRSSVVEIRTTLRRAPFIKGARRIPFGKIARVIFDAPRRKGRGKGYELSLVICGDSLAQRINKQYRRKSYKPNVLSFPLDTHEGEILLNAQAAKREARKYEVPLRQCLALLFVHGCLHLKGLRHGRTMEATEQKVLRAFRIVV